MVQRYVHLLAVEETLDEEVVGQQASPTKNVRLVKAHYVSQGAEDPDRRARMVVPRCPVPARS